MALTRTTLAGAATATDTQVTLTSITGLQVSNNITVDGEEMRVLSVGSAATVPVDVLRGVRGTNVAAHPTGATAYFGPPSDFGSTVASRSAPRSRDVVSYSLTGALTLPTPGRDMVAILNGTTVRAMTLAVPGKGNEGDVLTIIGNGKAAHTVTVAGGAGASSLTIFTFAAGGQGSISFIAANEVWVQYPSSVTGTLTPLAVAAT